MDVTVTPRVWPAGSIPQVRVTGGPAGARALVHLDWHVIWTGPLDSTGSAAVPPLRLLGVLGPGAHRLGVRVPAAWPTPATSTVVRVAVVTGPSRSVGSPREDA